MRFLAIVVIFVLPVVAIAADDPILTVPRLEKPAAKPVDGDPLQARYDAAWTRFQDAVRKATAEVSKALDTQFEKAADAGNLDLADMWDKKKKLFVDTKTLDWQTDGKAKVEWRKANPHTEFPEDFSEVVKTARQSFANAITALRGDYEALVKEYTKARNLARATALREELAGLGSVPAPAPSPQSPDEEGEQKERIVLTSGKLEENWQWLDAARAGNWNQADGLLVCRREGSSLVSKKRFRNFELQIDFMLPPRCNSGVFLRGCYEVQLLDSQWRDKANKPAPIDQRTGSVWRQIMPRVDAYHGPNEWNRMIVTLIGKTITIELNGKQIVQEQEIPKPTVGAPLGLTPVGPLVLQCGSEMMGTQFRNISVTPVQKK